MATYSDVTFDKPRFRVSAALVRSGSGSTITSSGCLSSFSTEPRPRPRSSSRPGIVAIRTRTLATTHQHLSCQNHDRTLKTDQVRHPRNRWLLVVQGGKEQPDERSQQGGLSGEYSDRW